MAGRTITRIDLTDIIVNKMGLSRQNAINVMESIFDSFIKGLERDKKVKISSFGSFTVRKKRQRIGRNPRTGDEVVILPRNVVLFRPSSNLKYKLLKNKLKH